MARRKSLDNPPFIRNVTYRGGSLQVVLPGAVQRDINIGENGHVEFVRVARGIWIIRNSNYLDSAQCTGDSEVQR